MRSTTSFYGWDTNLIGNLTRGSDFYVDWLAGFRYVHLEEDLSILQTSTLLAGGSTGLPPWCFSALHCTLPRTPLAQAARHHDTIVRRHCRTPLFLS